jgi:hypothetical protein
MDTRDEERHEAARQETAKGTPPQNVDEYLGRFRANERCFGYGLDVSMGMPCPFCAAPDFVVYRVVDVESAMNKGATCKECGRSARALFTHDGPSTSFEIVQTGGDDPPDWLTPKMRRHEASPGSQ